MYHEVGIQALSPKQISRLLNAHPVRVKAGSDAKIQVTTDHAKKLARAGMKGSALTVTLDPFAIQNNQHLRGQGPKGLKKAKKWYGAISDVLKPVAKPIIGALTDAAVQNIEAYGDQSARMAGMGKRGKRTKKVPLSDEAVQCINHCADKYRGGTALIDQPFTARQAVDTMGRFVKDPSKTLGFGVPRMLKKDRPKRVMSDAQKAALAKGRAALRLKLNEMGAGGALKQAGYGARGSALMQAGYGME